MTAAGVTVVDVPAMSFSPPTRITLVRWTPPRHGWVKLNFDGSVHNDGSGRASIGGVIRDDHGRVLLAFAERTPHATIGVVEARALIRGLQLALDHGWNDRLLVEGDDLTLVRLLRCESTHTRIPPAMLDDILWLLDSFRVCEVQHAYREGNQVADALCHEAYKAAPAARLWTPGTAMVPFPVWEKLEDDRRGVLHQRVRA
uniref:RNase H type-1 domain-containing protein n=1 Tax=Oryza rufipogon TaxID=4529 RepID=A0A0E0Q226_ORYRU